MEKKRMALIVEGQPDDLGRVHLTALWLQEGRERPRGQCFFVDPEEHFKGFATARFADDESALAWLVGP